MTPKWVSDLTEQVAKDEGKETLPIIKWRHQRHFASKYTSGTTYGSGKIVLTTGTSVLDQKLVLLHELSHWLVGGKEHHSLLFWDKAFELYRKHKIPMMYALKREKNYKKKSIKAYKKNLLRHQADLAIMRAEVCDMGSAKTNGADAKLQGQNNNMNSESHKVKSFQSKGGEERCIQEQL